MATTRHNEPVSEALRWKIVKWVVFDNEPVWFVAQRIERAISVVYRYVNIYHNTGNVLSDHELDRQLGYKRNKVDKKIDSDSFAVEYLQHTRIHKCDTTLKEYHEQLSNFGINASTSTIHRHFARNGITTKTISSVCTVIWWE